MLLFHWRFLLQENSKQYWPDSESEIFGYITVTLLKEQIWPNFICRHLRATKVSYLELISIQLSAFNCSKVCKTFWGESKGATVCLYGNMLMFNLIYIRLNSKQTLPTALRWPIYNSCEIKQCLVFEVNKFIAYIQPASPGLLVLEKQWTAEYCSVAVHSLAGARSSRKCQNNSVLP